MAVSKESTIFPVGTVFVDLGRYGSGVVLFYQVVRCTERTVWYLQIRAQVVAYDSAALRKDLVPIADTYNPNAKPHMARILREKTIHCVKSPTGDAMFREKTFHYVKSPTGDAMFPWDGHPVSQYYGY